MHYKRAIVLVGLIGATCSVAGSLQAIPPARAVTEETDASPMSKEWIGAMLAYGEPGTCNLDSPLYSWRNAGWGSNMNREFKSCTCVRVDVPNMAVVNMKCQVQYSLPWTN